MSEMSPEGRALLRRVRQDLDGSPEERDRIGRAIATRLGIAAGAVVGTTTTAAASTTAAAATTAAASGVAGAGAAGAAAGVGVGAGVAGVTAVVACKWIGATLLVAALSAGGVSAYHRETTVRPSPTVVTSAAPKPLAVNPRPVPAPLTNAVVVQEGRVEKTVTQPSAPASPQAQARAPHPLAQPPAVSPPAPSPVSPPSAPEGALGDETTLLRQADEALRNGDPARALFFLDAHGHMFPSGILAEERSAERVSTLCRLGRQDEARDEARRFLSKTPDSPLAATVRHSCAAGLFQAP